MTTVVTASTRSRPFSRSGVPLNFASDAGEHRV
jgi:hypothetical protein